MTRKKGRGASNQPFFRRSAKPMYYGNADSIEITPYFEDNYGDFLDEEAQFMAETSAREAATVSAFKPFGGNADTRLDQNLQNIYDETQGSMVPEYTGKPIDLNINPQQQTTELNVQPTVDITQELQKLQKVDEIEQVTNNENTSIMSGASGSLISAGAGMMSEGAMNIAQSFGMKRKRAEQRAANREHYRMRQDYMSLDVEDPYRNLTNPYDNMTVNQQMAQFEAQQNQQALANTLGSLQGAAGASGIAGLAQVVANQQSRNMQRASASIGLQEQSIGMARAATQARMQEQGAQLERKYKTEQAGTLYGIAQQRKSAADEAVEKARMGLAGGVLQTVQGAGMAVAGAVMGG